MERSAEDYYAMLGVEQNAGYDAIKQAWREKAKQWHPDTYLSEDEKIAAHHKFVDILEAYSVLTDEKKRADYDYRRSSGSAVVQTYSGYENANAAQDQKEAQDWYQSVLNEPPRVFAETTFVFLIMSPVMAFLCLMPLLFAVGTILQVVDGTVSGLSIVRNILILLFMFVLAAVGFIMLKDIYFRLKRILKWIALRIRINRLFRTMFRTRKPGLVVRQ
jgi:hypothetical protein